MPDICIDRIIVFSGQSNMQGQTEGDPHDNEFSGGCEYLLLQDEIIPLKNPVGEDIGELFASSFGGGGSLVPYFVRVVTEKTGENVLAVHCAKGATKISEWLSDGACKSRYEKLVEKVRSAANKIAAHVPIDFVWFQGESDAVAGTSKDDYENMLLQFENQLRKDLNIDTFSIIGTGYFSYLYADPKFDDEIMKAQDEMSETGGSVYADFDYARIIKEKFYAQSLCPGHYNNEAMKIIGEKAGSEFVRKIVCNCDKVNCQTKCNT